jgi:hypothetical protein
MLHRQCCARRAARAQSSARRLAEAAVLPVEQASVRKAPKRNERRRRSFPWQNERGFLMNDNDNDKQGHGGTPPEPRQATQQRAPERELELKLKKNPRDDNAKVDVGSDESMDASDPVAVTSPGGNDPVPSSSFPEDK